ncbi:MAG TPA: hypothetical protein VFO03_01170 [Gaiellaceae bacterium]|nr:hypothetical protein [Gaiellaceae bacterium]
MRAALLALLSALALIAAGCGGQDLGAGTDSPATMLKPGALVYWETGSDLGSDQWQQVEELVRRFPDGDKWLADLRRSFEEDTKLTWEEVEPALGDRFALAVYGRSTTDVQVVGLTKPDDPEKTIELVNRANREADTPEDRVVAREVDGWVVVSDKAASIDAALKGDGGEALADVGSFQDGMAELPDDALSRVYVDLAAAFDTFGASEPALTKSLRMLGLDQIDFAGAWAKARDDGAEVAGALRGEGADKLLGATDEYSSKLLDRVPADAFAFFTFQGEGITRQVDALRDNPLYGMALGDFEQETGVTLDDVIRLFKGEVVFYAAPGAPIPELTILLDADDPTAARSSAERILRSLAASGGGRVTEDGGVTTAVFEGVSVNLGSAGGALVISTSKDPFREADAADKLADTDRYKQALEAAGAPDQYASLAYVDLAETIKVILGFASASGETVPAEVSRNLEPLRSLVAYGAKDGELATSLVFVEIQ